ncbi:MAG: tryptophan--tRNA ligase [Thermodesulfobacteriota bacterium]|nr:tryptophan--tRNA ligase [Thermodesulfobacteriota bacterium]
MLKKRILSGMRPSGKLHLGNFYGALESWIKLQDEYECFYFAADWHALTSEYENTGVIKESIRDMFLDWLSAGMDPEKSTIFIQSKIPEHAELHVLLSMITPLSWLERNPTYKEQQQELTNRDVSTYGFLGYPVLQAADIIIYKAHRVPVGIDQVPHLELTREIARRFNFLYEEVFPLPKAILTEVPKLLGIDGRKMSKAYDNAIYLSDPPEVILEKVSQMITDPQRARRTDPGDPEVCNVFSFHTIFSPPEEVDEISQGCRSAGIGCVDCKKKLASRVILFLSPLQEKRNYYSNHFREVEEIVENGIKKARSIAKETMDEVRQAIQIE